MTGQDIYKDFKNRAGIDYSKFSGIDKTNRLFRRALNKTLLKHSFEWNQKYLDENKYLIKTEKQLTIRNNKFLTGVMPIENITAAGTVVTIQTYSDHGIQSGDSVTLSDIAGIVTNPPINAVWAVFGIPSADTFEINVTQAFGTYIPATGILENDYMLTDYLHLYSLKCKSEKRLPFEIIRVTQGGVVEFSSRWNLRDGDLISISGYAPIPTLSGNWYVKYLTSKKVKLYSDQELLNSAPNNLTSNTRGGVVKQIFYNSADPINSDQKAGSFVRGSNSSAKYETADGAIKIYPKEIVFTEVTVDYFARPEIAIDMNDNSIDLTLYYEERLLDRIIDEAVKLYTIGAHDQQLEGATKREQQDGQ